MDSKFGLVDVAELAELLVGFPAAEFSADDASGFRYPGVSSDFVFPVVALVPAIVAAFASAAVADDDQFQCFGTSKRAENVLQ